MLISGQKKFMLILIILYSCFTFSFSNNLDVTRQDKKILLDLKKIEINYFSPLWIGSKSQIMNVIFSTGDYLSMFPQYDYQLSSEFKNYTGVHKIVRPIMIIDIFK